MTLPNLFCHARSELAQDAVLAYILEWASPEFRDSHTKLHSLGTRLLRELVSRARLGRGDSAVEQIKIDRVEVLTQEDQIDVLVEINHRTLLIIEDKTESSEHSGQIARYLEKAASRRYSHGAQWQEHLAIYVKTGNESRRRLPASAHGHFMRKDLLRVLEHGGESGNDVVEEFRQHLRAMEEETSSFGTKEIDRWTYRAWQGLFMELEGWLYTTRTSAKDEDWWLDWNYVPNQEGGFLGFWWHWRTLEEHQCDLYLQIHHPANSADGSTPDFFIRAERWERDQHIDSKQLWEVWEHLERAAGQREAGGLHISKAGRFRAGKSAAVARLRFAGANESFLATDAHGMIDMATTQSRLQEAMCFLDRVCQK